MIIYNYYIHFILTNYTIIKTTIIFIAIQLYSLFAWGLTSLKMYNWFITDLFNLDNINYTQSLGLILFISLFKGMSIPIKSEYLSNIGIFINIFIQPFYSLLIAYIVYILI